MDPQARETRRLSLDAFRQGLAVDEGDEADDEDETDTRQGHLQSIAMGLQKLFNRRHLLQP